jgi:GTPase-associated protein 1, N-terminal domain type 2
MIEQLHFTWSQRGLQGRGMFQVTAVSPGLQDLKGELALLALRLCRWSGGQSQDIVSYGWIDARQHRFVFRRVAAGRTGDGRPGNFAAHVLVAPNGMLSVADLLQRPCGPHLWWGGEPETERTLPLLSPQPLCPALPSHPAAGAAGPADQAVLEATVQLLAQGAAGQIGGTWEDVLTAAQRCSAVMAAPFAALSSFSTFERGESADWFQLSGAGPRSGPGPAPAPAQGPVRTAASLILSADEKDTQRARAAAKATERAGQLHWQEFIALAAAFRSLLAEESVDCGELLPALGQPGTAAEVLQLRRGREVIADALIAGRRDVTAAMAVAASGINGNLLRTLGIDLASRGFPGSNWRALTGVAASLGDHALDGIAEVALGSAAADGNGWPGALLQACLRSPALPEGRVPGLASLVARSESLIPALSDDGIQPDHRAQVAVAAVAAGTLSPGHVAALTDEHPLLRNPTLAGLARTGQAEGVLAALSPADAARAVAEIAPGLPGSLRLAACRPVWPRLSLSAELDLAISLNGLTWQEAAADWSAIADHVVRKWARAELDDLRRALDPRTLLPACSASPAGKGWAHFLTAAIRVTRSPTRGNISRVGDSLRTAAMAADMIARSYAVQVILPVARREDVQDVLALLFDAEEPRDLRSAITAAERATSALGLTSLTFDIMDMIARSDRLDQATIEACGGLARLLDSGSWKFLVARLHDAPPDARRRLAAIKRRTMYQSVLPAGFRR